MPFFKNAQAFIFASQIWLIHPWVTQRYHNYLNQGIDSSFESNSRLPLPCSTILALLCLPPLHTWVPPFEITYVTAYIGIFFYTLDSTALIVNFFHSMQEPSMEYQSHFDCCLITNILAFFSLWSQWQWDCLLISSIKDNHGFYLFMIHPIWDYII